MIDALFKTSVILTIIIFVISGFTICIICSVEEDIITRIEQTGKVNFLTSDKEFEIK